MSDYSDFRARITRPDVEVIALHKQNLSRIELYRALYGCLRKLHPTAVHGRNWDGLDAMIVAWAAGVPVRIQGEHGRDMHDLEGRSHKQRWLRRLTRPFTHRYITVSEDLRDYLIEDVGIAGARVTRICNGVDTQRFRPSEALVTRIDPRPFVVGTVGRLVPVKDQRTLVRAIGLVARHLGTRAAGLRAVIVGDGPLRCELEAQAVAEGVADRVRFAGARDDVADCLREMDVFVLPSLGEGISNTVLEAMASALPVIATNVGGNSELIEDGVCGSLIAVGNADALAERIAEYLVNDELCRVHGRAARRRAEDQFSITAMVESYSRVYEELCGLHRREDAVT